MARDHRHDTNGGARVIAVLGATGTVGRRVCALLADLPVDARALVRRPNAADLSLPAVHADFSEPASLRSALEGATRLFLLTPHGPDQDLMEDAALDAALATGVERIVKISGSAPSLGPNGVTATAVAHWRSERRIEDTGLGFTFLRPSMYQQGVLVLPRLAGRLLVAPLGHAPIAMVDARDVASCAVAALTDPDPVDGAWQLTGPRGVSCDEIASHLGLRYVAIPPKLAARALARRGAAAWEIEHSVRMAAYFAACADGAPTDHVQRLTGRAPSPVEALLDEHSTTTKD
jgi:NAD(P)H dehydrogenase (quinone)